MAGGLNSKVYHTFIVENLKTCNLA